MITKDKILDTMLLPSYLALKDNPNYIWKNHLSVLETKLVECVIEKNKRIIVTMPPRHGKSEMSSKYFPAWALMKYPNLKIILASYESDFAASWGRKIRELINKYGDLDYSSLKNDSRAANRFSLKNESELITAGAGGAITGKGAHLLIIDDPVKNHEQAYSKTYREKTWEWFNTTAFTRLEPNGSAIIIQTRWHADDLAGRLLNQNNTEWENVNFPAIDDYGNALFPERFSTEQLLKIKEQIGTNAFASLYQQKPIVNDNQIYKESWWRYYNDLPTLNYIIQSWDTAFKEKEHNDYSVCTTIGTNGTNYYVLDVYRGKLEFPALQRRVVSLADKYKPDYILIEDKASGQSLIQTLRNDTNLAIKAIKANGDKELRAHLATPLIESGKVFLPERAEWLNDFLTETAEFPLSPHDDIVDSFNQGIEYLKKFGQKVEFGSLSKINNANKVNYNSNYYKGMI